MMTLFDLLNLATNKNLIFKTKMADGRCPDKFAVDILKATQQGIEPVWCGCRWGVYWRNLANTTEPFACRGNAALCQITLTLVIVQITKDVRNRPVSFPDLTSYKATKAGFSFYVYFVLIIGLVS